MSVTSPSSSHTPNMDKKRTRSMSFMKSDASGSRTDSTPSRLRRITSLSGWPRQRSPTELQGHSAATQEGVDTQHTDSRTPPSRSKLRRIASKSSRMFRTNSGGDAVQDTKDLSEKRLQSKDVSRRPSVVRLRRMASMPGRSLKRMASRSLGPSHTTAPSEGRGLSRMKSWSHSVRSGSSKWFVSSVSAASPAPPGRLTVFFFFLKKKEIISFVFLLLSSAFFSPAR